MVGFGESLIQFKPESVWPLHMVLNCRARQAQVVLLMRRCIATQSVRKLRSQTMRRNASQSPEKLLSKNQHHGLQSWLKGIMMVCSLVRRHCESLSCLQLAEAHDRLLASTFCHNIWLSCAHGAAHVKSNIELGGGNTRRFLKNFREAKQFTPKLSQMYYPQ